MPCGSISLELHPLIYVYMYIYTHIAGNYTYYSGINSLKKSSIFAAKKKIEDVAY